MHRVGDYEVLGKLGEGGMGVVYRARSRGAGRRPSPAANPTAHLRPGATEQGASDLVALKLLHPHNQGNLERRARFLREAQLGQMIDHPSVVGVRDFGEAHLEGVQRTLFLAQEFVPGRDLYYRAEIEGLPPRQIVQVLGQVASGLAAAHAAGVVHRDVKPGNVLVTSAGQAKLLDFGLARSLDEAPDQEDAELILEGVDGMPGRLSQGLDFRTAVGTSLGTAGYSPPEQLEGAAPHASADIYALGVSTYQLLAGRMPYRADTLAELRTAASRPAPTLEELGVSAPLGFSDYLASMLALRPEHRPQSCADVAAAFADFAAQWPEEEVAEQLTETGVGRLRSWLGGLGGRSVR